MKKVIFLDRDGTINIDKGYLYKIEEFEYKDGTVDGMCLLQQYGYNFIIITNQSGIARGYFSEQEYKKLEIWMINDLKTKGINILDCFYCPHYENGIVKKYSKKCNCRKPCTQMFQEAIKKYHIDTKTSYSIGDKIRDLTICKEVEMGGVFLGKGNGIYGKKIVVKENLYKAAKYIIEKDEQCEEN